MPSTMSRHYTWAGNVFCHRFRKSYGCLVVLFFVLISFLLVLQSTVQRHDNGLYFYSRNGDHHHQQHHHQHHQQYHQLEQLVLSESQPQQQQQHETQTIQLQLQLQNQQEQSTKDSTQRTADETLEPKKSTQIAAVKLKDEEQNQQAQQQQHQQHHIQHQQENPQNVQNPPDAPLTVTTNFLEQTGPHKNCRAARNVAFIKTHKAGSSTVANILQRFGITHNLIFALPNKLINTFGANYIVRPGEVFTPDRILPLRKGQTQYNILWSHSIYNKATFRSILPEDTKYISILREPFQQFVSSFEYYGVSKAVAKMNASLDPILAKNPVSAFLQSPIFSKFHPKQYGYVRNKQSQDLGFGPEEFYQIDKMESYIRQLDKDFLGFMIMEFFDESLILLRHKLCWDIKDILYIPKNKNRHKPNRTYSDWDMSIHKRFSIIDYNLYHHFLLKFKNEIESEPAEFLQEVSYFKEVLRQVAEFCPRLQPFVVPGTQWSGQFKVSVDDCKLMRMSELDGLKLLRNRYYEGREV